MKAMVSITGMHCESCVKKIENQIRPLVQEIHVSLHPPRAEITTDSTLNLNVINAELQKIGKYRFVSEKESLDEPTTEANSCFKTNQPLLVMFLMITFGAMLDRSPCTTVSGFWAIFCSAVGASPSRSSPLGPRQLGSQPPTDAARIGPTASVLLRNGVCAVVSGRAPGQLRYLAIHWSRKASMS